MYNASIFVCFHTCLISLLFVRFLDMGKTKYQKSWELNYPWLTSAKNDSSRGFCKLCIKGFKIDGSGECQVKSHGKSHQDDKLNANMNQRTFSTDGTAQLEPKDRIVLSNEDQVMKAEILQVLHCINRNYSLRSMEDDNKQFREMFPDSEVAKCYQQSETKVKYVMQYGIATYLKEDINKDISNIPYTFKFDETMNNQVKKLMDGYVQYWSKASNQIENVYCGSLFVGHCTRKDLVEHHNSFCKDMELDSNYLLQIGMDGPNVNLAFEEKVSMHLENDMCTNLLKLGSCQLHPTHSAFRYGVKVLGFDLDTFFMIYISALSYQVQDARIMPL